MLGQCFSHRQDVVQTAITAPCSFNGMHMSSAVGKLMNAAKSNEAFSVTLNIEGGVDENRVAEAARAGLAWLSEEAAPVAFPANTGAQGKNALVAGPGARHILRFRRLEVASAACCKPLYSRQFKRFALKRHD